MPTSVTYLTLFNVPTDTQAELRNSLLNGGLVLAQNSVALSTQRTYNCTQSNHDHMLQLLLMFISYCVDTLNNAPTSIPGILSALHYQFRMRCVHRDVTAAFDNCLIVVAKAGVARRRSDCRAVMQSYSTSFNITHKWVSLRII